MRKKYDWKALETEFVTSNISAAALAKKHGISPPTMYRHYQIDRWCEKRKEYLGSVIEKCADNAAYIAAVKLAKELDIANKLSGALNEAVGDEKQFYRYIVTEKAGGGVTETSERVFEKMDMRSLNNAIKALKSLEEIKSIMYGIVTPLEERKLKIEESKTAVGKNTTQEGGVVILPEIEEEKRE